MEPGLQTASTRYGATSSIVVRGLLAAVPIGLVAYAGSRVTIPAIPSWYEGLAKPPFLPPNAAFGPAWTVLYVLMAAAIYRVLASPPTPDRRRAILAHAVQLALNCLWSFAFFGARAPGLALGVIVALLAAIVWTIVAFRRVDETAAFVLLPYLGWVTFATYLNAGVWYLNRDA